MSYRGRDVDLVQLSENQLMVISCDSCGAIGSKKLDKVRVSNNIVGRLTVRVPLLEALSVGAVPKVISATISNEPDPTGEEIIKGIKEELALINLSDLPITISTEKNIPTSQTAVGVTVVGLCNNNSLRVALSHSGDIVYCLGVPKVGNELNGADDPDIIQANHIYELQKLIGIHDIIPIGSKGILRELEILISNVDCSFSLDELIEIDVHKSAGPSTCIIFTCSPDTKTLDFPLLRLTKLGTLV